MIADHRLPIILERHVALYFIWDSVHFCGAKS